MVKEINEWNSSYPQGVYNVARLTSTNYIDINKPASTTGHLNKLFWTLFRWKFGANIIMEWDFRHLGRKVSDFHTWELCEFSG